ncbi:hypothetical protein [Methanoculleus chikugoensis]|nr:hypothetical protein [Methanoculleus chikugoensis]
MLFGSSGIRQEFGPRPRRPRAPRRSGRRSRSFGDRRRPGHPHDQRTA